MKVKIYKSCNCLFHKAGRLKDELVTLRSVSSFCRPYLLYATECLGLTARQMRSLHNTWQCAVSHISNVHGTKFYLYYYWQCIPGYSDSSEAYQVFAESTKRPRSASSAALFVCALVSSFGWELLIEVWFLPHILLFMLYVLVCFFLLFYFLSRGISTVCLLPYGE